MAKIGFLSWMLLIMTTFFVSYQLNQVQAEVINDGYEFNHEFLSDFRTQGVIYFDPQTANPIKDETSIPERVLVIDNQNMKDGVFSSFDHQIDFNQEVIIIYAFTGYEYIWGVSNVNLDDQMLKIQVKVVDLKVTQSGTKQNLVVIKASKGNYQDVLVSKNPTGF